MRKIITLTAIIASMASYSSIFAQRSSMGVTINTNIQSKFNIEATGDSGLSSSYFIDSSSSTAPSLTMTTSIYKNMDIFFSYTDLKSKADQTITIYDDGATHDSKISLELSKNISLGLMPKLPVFYEFNFAGVNLNFDLLTSLSFNLSKISIESDLNNTNTSQYTPGASLGLGIGYNMRNLYLSIHRTLQYMEEASHSASNGTNYETIVAKPYFTMDSIKLQYKFF